ncbi:MAG: ferredoxin-thioredoxin reductase catalytic domain-containing protein [Prochloraceae cyanobacterium]
MTSANTDKTDSDKILEAMKNFAEQYAKRTNTYFCSDLGVTAVVVEGLAKHKEELGAPLCPCRHYEDKEAEVKNTFWNCPCVPMRERKECHCMLFITPDNEFAGEEQEISLEYIKQVRENMAS